MELFNRKHLDNSLEYRIARLPRRLKNSVTQIDILNWLENFKPSEFTLALSILEALEYISEFELVEYLDARLNELFMEIEGSKKINLIPFAEFGKSSTLLMYYLKKTPFFRSHETRIHIIPHYNILKKNLAFFKEKDPIVVFVDDFIGSGNSLIKYEKAFISAQFSIKKITPIYIVMCIYYLEKSKRKVEDVWGREVRFVGEMRHAGFERGKSPFTGNQRIEIRKFAYHYGQELFSIGKPPIAHPLGFENSQALVVFPYNPPNNTLPIIWSAKDYVPSGKKWIPLYPRISQTKIAYAKKLRSEYAFEMGLLRTTELEPIFYSGKLEVKFGTRSFVQHTDFKTFVFLRLKMEKRSESIICQLLGISLTDLEEIKANAINKNIFDEYMVLTEYGRKSYNSIMEILQKFKSDFKSFSRPVNEEKEILYLPKVFRGQAKELD